MTRQVFLSGANGFVGAGVLSVLLRRTDWDFILPTTATHHGSQTRLNQVLDSYWRDQGPLNTGPDLEPRVRIVHCDLSQPFDHSLFGGAYPDLILNVSSECHVDRSIAEPRRFIRNNVDLMLNVLEYARQVKPTLVLQMSTDEVYGNARSGEFHKEWDPIRPSNPYAASKAAQEAIAYSYWRTYNVPLAITNTMNLLCPPSVTFQDTEKFVPMVVSRLLKGEDVKIHVDENGVSGTRCWIDVRDFADAWLHLIEAIDRGVVKERLYMPHRHHTPPRFNIVGREMSNQEVAERLAVALGIENPSLVPEQFHATRPGHDPRYALDGYDLANLGWEPKLPLGYTLESIAREYQENPELL